MNYTPDDQDLTPAITIIREGLKAFHRAAQARMDAGREYTQEHRDRLVELRSQMLKLDNVLEDIN